MDGVQPLSPAEPGGPLYPVGTNPLVTTAGVDDAALHVDVVGVQPGHNVSLHEDGKTADVRDHWSGGASLRRRTSERLAEDSGGRDPLPPASVLASGTRPATAWSLPYRNDGRRSDRHSNVRSNEGIVNPGTDRTVNTRRSASNLPTSTTREDARMAEPADPNSAFLDGVDEWIGMLGRLRDVVRQHVVAAQLAEILHQHGPRPARVLDVGCGQGTQGLLLARAGHDVTGLDISADLLARFEADLAMEPADVRSRVHVLHGLGEEAPRLTTGRFDVVVCHGVLMYLEDIATMVRALSLVASPAATMSLLVRNGLATAMRDGLRGNWQQALDAFDSRDYVNRLGLSAHAHTPDELDRALGPHGWRRDAWYGVRVFCDHRDDKAPSHDELSTLLAAEEEAGRRDPYRQVAALLHLIYRRPGPPAPVDVRGQPAAVSARRLSLPSRRLARAAPRQGPPASHGAGGGRPVGVRCDGVVRWG